MEYTKLLRSAKGSGSDKLLCMICNVTCLRSNFSSHKNNAKHIMNLKSKVINNNSMFAIHKVREEIQIASESESESESESASKSESESESESENDEVTYEDCTKDTMNLIKIKRNCLISKMPKYWTDNEKLDYSVMDRIVTKQPVSLIEFQQTFNRLTK